MPTSQEASTFLNDVLSAEVIPEGKMAYFRGRLANRFHALVLSEFARLEAAGKINGSKLARRISREPAQISRWLGSAGNWTFDTLSDLLLGMGYEPDLSVIDLRAEGKHIQDAEGLACPSSAHWDRLVSQPHRSKYRR